MYLSVSFSVWFDLAIVVAYIAAVVSCIVVVLSENRNPIRAIAWVIALLFLPGVGMLFYLFFGRGIRNMHIISRRNKRRLLHNTSRNQIDLESADLSLEERQLVKLVNTVSHTPLTLNNSIEIFTEGKPKFEALKRDIINARQYIFLQYYIFTDDAIGNEIADMLIAKAREGVLVRVLYDHVGSFSARRKFFSRMRDAGVEAHPFFKVTFPQLANRINWRNHRKIAIFDGKVAYIGGMNIADRYVTGENKNRPWRDSHFRVKGDIMSQLLFSFCVDWNFLNPKAKFTPIQCPDSDIRNKCGMQLVTSGPTDKWGNIALVFLKAISSAKHTIYIQTPYFLPSDPLMRALEAAALAKVDVRIMMPRKGDSLLLQYASYSFIKPCLQAGITVYLYEPGMLHAKTLIVDDEIVSTGSTNFDYRSFENNFECNLMVYSPDFNTRMKETFYRDIEQCTRITLTDWTKRPAPQRTLESIVRLLSPIL